MWDLLLNLASFMIGISVGTARATKVPESTRLTNLQDQLNESFEREQLMRDQWLDAEDKAETWKRRYENLLPSTQTSFEE
ncbi:MAG UNVERIFIED_CONTAM: hypothetical protein LVQ98_07825 [Rickettsiaceae bacterium]|jgi:hypothetical protein